MRHRRMMVLVGVLAVVSLAPASDQPEQISAAEPVWDTAKQELDVQISVKRSMIDPSPSCSDCEIRTVAALVSVTVVYDESSIVIAPAGGPVALRQRPGVILPERGFVEVAPISISWDRDDGRVRGAAEVEVTVELVRSDGVAIPGSTTEISAEIVFD